jgi:predicted TIM-barrel fold metal-dependent hydrolase
MPNSSLYLWESLTSNIVVLNDEWIQLWNDQLRRRQLKATLDFIWNGKATSNSKPNSEEDLMKIDIYSHILPAKYLETFSKKNPAILKTTEARNRAIVDLEMRLRLMDRYPDVAQVLTIAQPAVESMLGPKDAVELAKIANDELAEIVGKYPDKFLGAAACLPLNDMEAALQEADRAILQLGFRGVEIYTTVNGETLDQAKFRPLYEKMVRYDLPIWIHCCTNEKLGLTGGLLNWPFETASAMQIGRAHV